MPLKHNKTIPKSYDMVQFHCNSCGCTFYPLSEDSLIGTGRMAQCPGCGCITSSKVYTYDAEEVAQ